MTTAALRRMFDANRRWSDQLAAPLVRRGRRVCPTFDFRHRLVPSLLRPGMRVLDAGGGKHPCLTPELKRELQLYVVGLDVSADELAAAPAGSYDDVVVGDVCRVPLRAEFDVVVSQTLLEHVRDAAAAVDNLATALGDGGTMAHLLPNARAPFALVNRMLGHRAARRLLYAFCPERRTVGGFEAYYDRCTPNRMREICRAAGLERVETTPYYVTDYFRFCLPLYAVELARQSLVQAAGMAALCELFAVTARRPTAAVTVRQRGNAVADGTRP